MRTAAAEVRRDALAGVAPDEAERFVDTLLAMKANLNGNGNDAGHRGRRR
jgi:hypothetical protein